MIHVFVLLLVGVFGGTVANDTPAAPLPMADACADAARAFIEFAKSHGVSDPYTTACVPMSVLEAPEMAEQTKANEDPRESVR